MGLPTSKNTVYASGSQVKAADLTDVQDWIVVQANNMNKAFLRGLLGDHLMRLAAWPALRPLGRCGALYGQTSGNGPTMKFLGGLWVSSGGDATTPIMAYLAADDEINIALGAYPGAGQFR